MKIMLCNHRYFLSGGPERYLFAVQELLEREGHQVFPFSVHFQGNRPSPCQRYFVEPIASRTEAYFAEHKRSFGSLWRGLERLFYSPEVERAARRMAGELTPDVAYILGYLRKLSPSLLVGLKKQGIPIVVRLSDFGMLCPQQHFLRNQEPCTVCLEQGLFASVRHRCVKDSLPLSLVNYLATRFHEQKRYFDLIDAFVTTNPFTQEMLLKAGYAPERLHCIPTFVDTELFAPVPGEAKGDYGLYVGRLDPPKGVHVLLKALHRLKGRPAAKGLRMKIVGQGHDQTCVQSLRDAVRDLGLGDMVELPGPVAPEAVPALLRQARFSVLPAIWFENLPNSLLESLACGTPVIASDIGSLSRAITDGGNGLLFKAGDADSLADALARYLGDEPLQARLALGCRESALQDYAPSAHLSRLLRLFEDVSQDRQGVAPMTPASGRRA